MLAFFCELCSLMFWLNDDVVQDYDQQFLIHEYAGRRISCPCCTSTYNVKRSPENDFESEEE